MRFAVGSLHPARSSRLHHHLDRFTFVHGTIAVRHAVETDDAIEHAAGLDTAGKHVRQEFGPELVVLDIGLPGMDGYEIARRLRALNPARMRLVALTARPNDPR